MFGVLVGCHRKISIFCGVFNFLSKYVSVCVIMGFAKL